jgi:tripartite-type tricarboxylate transporter receptor subunit TctC
MPYAKSGTVKFISLTDGKRSASEPTIPTIAEQGFGGYSVDNWIGLLAPAGTAPAIIDRLFRAVDKVMKQPDIDKDLRAIGFEPWLSDSPAQFSAFLDHDIQKYKKAVKKANIKAY